MSDPYQQPTGFMDCGISFGWDGDTLIIPKQKVIRQMLSQSEQVTQNQRDIIKIIFNPYNISYTVEGGNIPANARWQIKYSNAVVRWQDTLQGIGDDKQHTVRPIKRLDPKIYAVANIRTCGGLLTYRYSDRAGFTNPFNEYWMENSYHIVVAPKEYNLTGTYTEITQQIASLSIEGVTGWVIPSHNEWDHVVKFMEPYYGAIGVHPQYVPAVCGIVYKDIASINGISYEYDQGDINSVCDVIVQMSQNNAEIEIVVGMTKTHFDPCSTFTGVETGVVLCCDLSGSMHLYGMVEFATNLVNELRVEGIKLGVTSFVDFPIEPFGSAGDYPYKLEINLTDDYDSVISVLQNMVLFNGGDTPESQLYALKNTAEEISWGNSLRNIVLFTDADFHNPEPGTNVSTPGYPGPSWNTTLSTLLTKRIRVFGKGSTGDTKAITEQTGGVVLTDSMTFTEIASYLRSPSNF